MRLQRGTEHLHQLGARATAEALAEIAARTGILPAIIAVLEQYQRLTPQQVRAAGGERFPPPVMRDIPPCWTGTRELRS